MWLYTNIGFFSIVEKPWDQDQNTVTVRARVKADLQALKLQYLPSMSGIHTTNNTDYVYRARVRKSDLAKAMGAMVNDICYDNFKEEVRRVQGPTQASFHSDIWGTTLEMGHIVSALHPDPYERVNRIAMPPGGDHCAVVFDDQDRVMLKSYPGIESRTIFMHLAINSVRGPQGDLLSLLYHLTGHMAKMAAKCSIHPQPGFEHWGHYLIPLRAQSSDERLHTNYCWVPINQVEDHIAKIPNQSVREHDRELFRVAGERYEQGFYC